MSDLLPNLGPPLAELLHALCRWIPELNDIDPHRIVAVSASAHGRSVASVRDLRACSETVNVADQPKDIELSLRPLFFLSGDPAKRTATLVHELLHIGTPFGLNQSTRHTNISTAELNQKAATLTQTFLDGGRHDNIRVLSHQGAALFQQWKTRPISDTKNRRFSDDDLCKSVVFFDTPKPHRVAW